MSGFVGLLNLDGSPVDEALLGRLTDFLASRGPDAQKTWIHGQVGLGQALLQTAEDCRPEDQPLVAAGPVALAADARVDGRLDLLRRLETRNPADLQDAPDGELLLRAYLAWGEECLAHLLGDFSFVLWDGRRGRLFCARDHLGIKPLYYARAGNSLLVSNTLNCLRRHPGVSNRLNELALADFLLFDYNQDPGATTFADIQRLPPAHSLIWESGRLTVRPYWSLPFPELLRYSRQQDYVDHFREVLDVAVTDRLRTRRPAVSMSGGMDSTTVAAAAVRALPRGSAPYDFRAYTVVCDHPVPDEERGYAGSAAARLGIPVFFQQVKDYQLYSGFRRNSYPLPEPVHAPLYASWIDLVHLILPHSRVVLFGEGGDALTGYSPRYVYDLLRNGKLIRLAVEAGRCLQRVGCLPPVGFRTGLRRWLFPGKDNEVFPPWLSPASVARLELRSRWATYQKFSARPSHPRGEIHQQFACSYWQMLNDWYYETGALGIPLECRLPFFDLRLVTFMLALPPLPWCLNKTLFREAGRDLLPEEVRLRPKAGVAHPLIMDLIHLPESRWLDNLPLHPLVADLVSPEHLFPLTKNATYLTLWSKLRVISLSLWLEKYYV